MIYGEPLFNAVVCEALGLELDEPPDDFLVTIGEKYTGRWVQMLTAREARKIDKPTFFKPPQVLTKVAIIEANEAPASGLYQCDPDKVLDVLHASVRRPFRKESVGKVVQSFIDETITFVDGTKVVSPGGWTFYPPQPSLKALSNE